jgi:hypothetical protein
MRWKRSCDWLRRTWKTIKKDGRRKMSKKELKPEYQPGGSKRQHILDKAVKFLLDPKFGTQNSKHMFLIEEVGLSSSEYFEALERATNSKEAW